MTVVTNTDFVNEVKVDRLRTMLRATLAIAVIILLAVLTFGVTRALASSVSIGLILASGVCIIGCLLAGALLRAQRVDTASWVYVLGMLLAFGMMIAYGDEVARQNLVFVYPVLVFVVGLLITPLSTIAAIVVAVLIIVGVPFITSGELLINTSQLFAMLLMVLAALYSAQVAGELYQVTEWALSNYKRERKVNDELFENRQKLTMALKRSEVLGENLLETNEELEQANQAAEDAKNFRGQFLANMSHELRTPLNAIIGFSETMLQFPIMYDDEKLPSPYERDLSQIYSSGRQLLHVINDILDLAKVDAGKLEVSVTAVDPLPLMLAAMSTTKGLLGNKPVLLEKDVPDDLPLVRADETRLRQVLLNLYSNAAKYTDSGSIKLIARVIGDEMVVSIKDTGIGIDSEDQHKLFQEFQQAKAGGRNARSGSGLGLAISRQLLELMGGRIWMESRVGEGSTFSFAVALYRDETGQEMVAMPVNSGVE